MQMRTTLGRVRGFGSTNDGVGHWWQQRVTGIALVPLTIWFVYAAIKMAGADLAAYQAWISTGGNAVLMSLLLFATFHHTQLGVQVVVEDYVQHEGAKLTLILFTKFACVLFGAASIFAVMRVAFGG